MASKGFAEGVAGDPTTTLDSTGLFKRGDMPPKIGYLSGAGVFAFNRKQGEVSDVMDNQDAFYVLVVKERTKKGLQPLPAVRSRIVDALKDSLAMKDAKVYAGQLLEKVKGGATLEEIQSSDKNIVAGTAEDQTPGGFIPQIGPASKTAAVAFRLPAGTVSGLIAEKGGYSFVRTIKKSEPALFDLVNNPQARQAAEMVRTQGRQMAYSEWFKELHERAKIVSKIERFYLD
jgi:parvulin-like peptidyl-prolyl isomerase